MITLTREEAQQVLNALEHAQATGPIWKTPIREAKETLRARLEQPEPKPVADKYLMEIECTKCGAKQDGILTVNTPPQRNEPEPVMLMDAPLLLNGQPLYTAPPQREWQGLTDEEITALKHNGDRYISSQDFARAIEAKLKEKNASHL
jgi:hypothetical protein